MMSPHADDSTSQAGKMIDGRVPVTRARIIITIVLSSAGAILPLLIVVDPLQRWAAAIAALCLVLWFSETVPSFAPTLLLIPSIALAMHAADAGGLSTVLAWAADPVLALFLGGFVLAVAAARYGIDEAIADRALTLSRGRDIALILLCAGATALLSMWISNIAAAALMIGATRPILKQLGHADRLRRGLLISIAFAANLGGMATPIGTGPNAIAVAEITRHHELTFIGWMGFTAPLTIAMIGVALVIVVLRYGIGKGQRISTITTRPIEPGAKAVVALFLGTVALWLTEPLHGIPAAVVALLTTAALFLGGLLDGTDLKRVDWSTLLSIAGGIVLGRMLEETRIVHDLAGMMNWSGFSPFLLTFLLCLTCAILSALMSNTASAALLIPLAASIDPSPSLTILIAVAASLGSPFIISTPPNMMVYGEGGIRTNDLAIPGVIIMIGGILLISLTGRDVLRWVGIP